MEYQNTVDFHSERKPSIFSFDDSATLDPTVLDTPVLMSPSSTNQIFSPNTSVWDDFSAAPYVDRTANASVVHGHGHGHGNGNGNGNANNPFFTEQSNNPFARLPANQVANYGQQPSWPARDDDDDATTPTLTKPNPFGDFSGPQHMVSEPAQPISYHSLSLQTNVRPSSVFPQQEGCMSPHTNSEWMAFNQQEMDARPGPKRMRQSSPPRSFTPRRDGGIRKKNARFDIPAERNLFNIDQLIASCNNEDDMKELKQQKRLLRNRQAALDSRQRKKKHTEELEEEKKLWTDKLCAMTDDYNALRLEYDQLLADKENWHREQMDMHHVIGQLNFDKEELVRSHTLETGELRKKVSVLTERLEQVSMNPSVAPAAAFDGFTTEMDNLHMGHNEWDNFICSNDFIADESTPQPQQPYHELATVPRAKEQEKPVASGLLLMLLLCGAFVASKSAGSTAPPIPRMPDEVRAASATVLDSIFKDAGIAPTLTETGVLANVVNLPEPAPSGVRWPKPNAMPGPASSLDQLHNHLTAPTKDQENEQLFSVTPAQYNSMTSLDFTRPRYSISGDDFGDALSPTSQPSHRRNLAEALAAMREQNKGDSAAEVYTRSLLWEKIAPEVVIEFKRMVEESAASSRPTTSAGISPTDMDAMG